MTFRRGCVPIDDAISFIFMTRVIRQEKARALLLRFLSLHNYEILRCIVVIGDQAQPAMYLHARRRLVYRVVYRVQVEHR